MVALVLFLSISSGLVALTLKITGHSVGVLSTIMKISANILSLFGSAVGAGVGIANGFPQSIYRYAFGQPDNNQNDSNQNADDGGEERPFNQIEGHPPFNQIEGNPSPLALPAPPTVPLLTASTEDVEKVVNVLDRSSQYLLNLSTKVDFFYIPFKSLLFRPSLDSLINDIGRKTGDEIANRLYTQCNMMASNQNTNALKTLEILNNLPKSIELNKLLVDNHSETARLLNLLVEMETNNSKDYI